jgi:hypothetical protein
MPQTRHFLTSFPPFIFSQAPITHGGHWQRYAVDERLRLAQWTWRMESTISCGLPGTRMRSFHVPRTEGLGRIRLFTYKVLLVLGICYTLSLDQPSTSPIFSFFCSRTLTSFSVSLSSLLHPQTHHCGPQFQRTLMLFMLGLVAYTLSIKPRSHLAVHP